MRKIISMNISLLNGFENTEFMMLETEKRKKKLCWNK